MRHALADGRLRTWKPAPGRSAGLGDLPAGAFGWSVDVSDPASRSPTADLTVAVVALPAGTSADEVLTTSTWDPIAGARVVGRTTGSPRLVAYLRGRSAGSSSATAFAKAVFAHVRDEVE